MTILRSPFRALALVLAALTLGACSAGEETLAEADVEAEVSAELAASVGEDPPNIDCPSDLPAEVGATMECELSVDGDPLIYPVTVTVESLDDGDATFSAEVGTEPLNGDSTSTSV